MDSLDKIYEMLHWHSRFDVQLRGIELARKLDDLSSLMQPLGINAGKAVWENCARVLYELPDNRLEKYVPLLLEWLQDYTWPGALIIRDRLVAFSGEKLKNPLIEFVEKVAQLQNEEGLMWLDNLSELLDNEELKNDLPHDVLDVLQKHYHNWGNWDEE
jgi:hypothetical protein